MGRPVVCLKLGGPAQQVSEQCGFLIEAASPKKAIIAISGAIRQLATDRELRMAMGVAAQERIKSQFTWSTKIDTVRSIYDQCVSKVTQRV